MSSNDSDSRCQYTKSDGRRCRSVRATDHPAYCAQHAGWLLEGKKPEDYTTELLGPLGDHRTAAAINYALGKLVVLVASHRISPKEAATLGYLLQLLLQSVHGVGQEVRKTKIDRTSDSDGLRRILEQTASLLAG